MLLQLRCRHVRVTGQGLLQPSHQRAGQAAGLQPRRRLVIQAVAELLPPQRRQDILARTAGTGVVTGEAGIANDVAHLVLPVHAGAGLVGGNPRPGRKARPMNGLRFVRPASIGVQRHARQRAGANHQPNIPQEGQQGGLTHVRAVPEGENQRMDGGAKPAAIAGWQGRGDGRLRAGRVPDLAHEADDLDVDPQPLHDAIGCPVARGIGRQGGGVNHAVFLVGDGQGLVLFWACPGACACGARLPRNDRSVAQVAAAWAV